MLFIAMRLMRTYLEVYMHDRIPSERRATILSLASTINYLCYFGLAAVFTLLVPHHGSRKSFIIMSLPLFIAIALDIARKLPWASVSRRITTDPYVDF